jgi:thiamine-phosphate pyrophosphorylase
VSFLFDTLKGMFWPPPLYPILDASCLPVEARELSLRNLASGLLEAGVTLLQYRNKQGSDREQLEDAKILREILPSGRVQLIFNDRADLAVLVNFDGVHLGQTDLSPQGARRVVGDSCYVGISTHNEDQLRKAIVEPVDYVAIGPVFATSSKQNPDPVVGLQGVKMARSFTTKPLVAIGGIDLNNAKSVLESGADSVAVISAIFSSPEPPQIVRDFSLQLRR